MNHEKKKKKPNFQTWFFGIGVISDEMEKKLITNAVSILTKSESEIIEFFKEATKNQDNSKLIPILEKHSWNGEKFQKKIDKKQLREDLINIGQQIKSSNPKSSKEEKGLFVEFFFNFSKF